MSKKKRININIGGTIDMKHGVGRSIPAAANVRLKESVRAVDKQAMTIEGPSERIGLGDARNYKHKTVGGSHRGVAVAPSARHQAAAKRQLKKAGRQKGNTVKAKRARKASVATIKALR
tara:strand:- start:1622 stop:1978 length:357 start_codon:yes stop_codon:yes gene_type:complete